MVNGRTFALGAVGGAGVSVQLALAGRAVASTGLSDRPVAIGAPGLSQPGHRRTGHRRGRPCHAGGAGPEDYQGGCPGSAAGADVSVERRHPGRRQVKGVTGEVHDSAVRVAAGLRRDGRRAQPRGRDRPGPRPPRRAAAARPARRRHASRNRVPLPRSARPTARDGRRARQAHIDRIAREHRPLVDRLHRLIRTAQPDAHPGISYGRLCYRAGARRLYLGAWKHGLSICGWPQGQETELIACAVSERWSAKILNERGAIRYALPRRRGRAPWQASPASPARPTAAAWPPAHGSRPASVRRPAARDS